MSNFISHLDHLFHWIEKHNKMSNMRPNFFIIGAPKCGTTSLALWLAEHHSVFMSVPKEPHYFNFDMNNRTITTEESYLKLFDNAGASVDAIGEASTWYLHSRKAVGAIEHTCPNAKYIVMVREQVSMAESLYYHNLRHLHENAPTFQQAWELQGMRKKGLKIPPACADPAFLQYKNACSLGAQVQRLLSKVPASRVLIIDLADLKDCPKREYQRVMRFLDLDGDRESFFPENEARVPRSLFVQRIMMFGGGIRRAIGLKKGFGLLKFNEKKIKKKPMSRSFYDCINQAFREDKALLNELIKKQRSF